MSTDTPQTTNVPPSVARASRSVAQDVTRRAVEASNRPLHLAAGVAGTLLRGATARAVAALLEDLDVVVDGDDA